MADYDWEEEFEFFIYGVDEYFKSDLSYDEELMFQSEIFDFVTESFGVVYSMEGNKRAREILKENSFVGLDKYDEYFLELIERLEMIFDADAQDNFQKNKLTEKRKFVFQLSFKETIRFCGYFFPKKFREEAKGDITETRQEMISDGYSKIIVNLFSSFKIICFILSTLRIRWSDFVDSGKERNW